MKNKFTGRCACGARVEAGAGQCNKRDGRWIVTCAECHTGEDVGARVQRDEQRFTEHRRASTTALVRNVDYIDRFGDEG